MRFLFTTIFSVIFFSISAAQLNFIVTSSGDEGDSDLEDNIFEPRTLRSAIENANLTSVKDVISFVDVERVILTGSLPAIAHPIEIDGYISTTEKVVIDGATISSHISTGIALGIESDYSIIHHLSLVNFKLGAISIFGDNSVIDSVNVGTINGVSSEPNGDPDVPQNTPSIHVRGDYNEITNSLISGNFGHGIRFNPFSDSMNVVIQNNIIGLDSSGTIKLANAANGIVISKGSYFIDHNTISGNDWNGVLIEGIESEKFESRITGNNIGLNRQANQAIGNGFVGIHIKRDNVEVDLNEIGGNEIGIRVDGNWGVIDQNAIGTTFEPSYDFGNSQQGIVITGTNTTLKNSLISANSKQGVLISSSDNIIEGNIIGLNAEGDSLLGNHMDGIEIDGEEATNNLIQNNTISGNLFNGIRISGNTNYTIIEGNNIGTNLSGSLALGNKEHGILLIDVARSIIGPLFGEKGNIISGNGQIGIYSFVSSIPDSLNGDFKVYSNKIGVDHTGSIGLGNSGTGIHVENDYAEIEYNIISDNYTGLVLFGDNGLVNGNLIGTDTTGTIPIGNERFGIELRGDSTSIGSTVFKADRNIISANGIVGLLIYSSNNTISGNFIGTDSNAEEDLGNGDDGIRFLLNSSKNDVIDNVIMGNAGNGIKLFGNNSEYIITGNGIGVDLSETEFAMNDGSGIVIQNSDDIFIGLPKDGGRNFISSNGRYGIEIIGQVLGDKEGISIQNNSIGDFENGEEPNLEGGIYIEEGSNIYIGGEYSSDYENVISGNEFNGIMITDLNSGNSIESDSIFITGNFIGYDRDADSLGNKANGIRVDAGKNIFIGTESNDYINEIGNNGENGLLVTGDSKVYVGVNHFSKNIELGIDLGNDGISINDTSDVDEGPNSFLNYPIIDDANYNTETDKIEVNARLISTPEVSDDYKITFYISETCDEGGFGEGEYYIGESFAETDNQGVATIANNMDDSESEADFEDYKSVYLTAISTKTDVGSSEFSQCFFVPLSVIAENVPDLIISKTDSLETIVGSDVIPNWTYTITAKNIGAIPATEIEIIDTLSTNLSVTDTTITHGYLTINENIVIGHINEILPGDSVTLKITVETETQGELINTAYVILSEEDASPLNNIASDTTDIRIEVSDELKADFPENFRLNQNYPNPFNPSTNINFSIPELSYVEINIYNSIGVEVAKLIQENKAPGTYSIRWDASNFASGFYIYKMVAGSYTSTKKMLLIK